MVSRRAQGEEEDGSGGSSIDADELPPREVTLDEFGRIGESFLREWNLKKNFGRADGRGNMEGKCRGK